MTRWMFSHRRLAEALGIWICVAAAAPGAQKQTPARPPWNTSRIQGSPEAPPPYRIAPAFPQLRFQKPSSIEELPQSNRLLVTEMAGKIFSFPKDPAVRQADLVIDLAAQLPPDLAGQSISLFDAEPHPKFPMNRHLFVCYVHPGEGGHTRVSRLTLTGDASPAVVPGS
jgi:hypothetical protein